MSSCFTSTPGCQKPNQEAWMHRNHQDVSFNVNDLMLYWNGLFAVCPAGRTPDEARKRSPTSTLIAKNRPAMLYNLCRSKLFCFSRRCGSWHGRPKRRDAVTPSDAAKQFSVALLLRNLLEALSFPVSDLTVCLSGLFVACTAQRTPDEALKRSPTSTFIAPNLHACHALTSFADPSCCFSRRCALVIRYLG